MPAILTWGEIRVWAWSWAQSAVRDEHELAGWAAQMNRMMQNVPDPISERYERALGWASAAYFEYLDGRWSKERARKQIGEAKRERMACDAYFRS